MMMTCSNCGTVATQGTRFCGACGQPQSPPHAIPNATSRRNLALFGVACALLASFCIGTAVSTRAPSRAVYDGPIVRGHLQLRPKKSERVYNMLAPSDVRVIVSLGDDGVQLRGTPREIAILERFAEILTRTENRDPAEMMSALRSTWSSKRTYRLPRSQAKRLRNVLAFDDVPVLVSRDGRRVTVSATPADQSVIADVVRILRGERLYDSHSAH